MYAYRAGFLKAFAGMSPSQPEQLEKLEQLRALSNGYRIHVDIAAEIPGVGVDTEEDAHKVSAILQGRG
jgi:3-deoxy-manno-octulosonate cytidylyltransferase (CMP-KDO synthetase)